MLTSEVAVVKSHHGISIKCSRHRDTGPTDPSLIHNNISSGVLIVKNGCVLTDLQAIEP